MAALVGELGCLEQAWGKQMQEFAIRHGKQGMHWRSQSVVGFVSLPFSIFQHRQPQPTGQVPKDRKFKQKRLGGIWFFD
jgi:hypothetical protein